MSTGQDIFHCRVMWVHMVGFPRIVQPWTATANVTDSCRLSDMLCESSIGGVVSFPFDFTATFRVLPDWFMVGTVGPGVSEYAAGETGTVESTRHAPARNSYACQPNSPRFPV